MMIDILKDIVNDIKLKSNNSDCIDYEEYKHNLDIKFGNKKSESNKVIKEYQNNT